LNAANARHPITEEEEKKYYEERKAEFARAKVKVLYVAFNDNPLPNPDPKAKKPLTSAQAKQKIDGLRKQLAGGADFLALVKQHSDDEESQAKEGDFGAFSPTDQNLPPVIKTAIFSLKPGQVSDPIEQANGYYLFRLESFTTPEFEEVKQDIFGKLQRERLDQWVESVKKSVKLEFAEPVYWTPPKP
jgi:parvulin-like peptidyl-prolyl isomerase